MSCGWLLTNGKHGRKKDAQTKKDSKEVLRLSAIGNKKTRLACVKHIAFSKNKGCMLAQPSKVAIEQGRKGLKSPYLIQVQIEKDL